MFDICLTTFLQGVISGVTNLPRGSSAQPTSSGALPGMDHPFGENSPSPINDWKREVPRGQRVLDGVSGACERGCASSAQGKSITVSLENEIGWITAIVLQIITTSPLAAITREQAVRLKLSQFVAATPDSRNRSVVYGPSCPLPSAGFASIVRRTP